MLYSYTSIRNAVLEDFSGRTILFTAKYVVTFISYCGVLSKISSKIAVAQHFAGTSEPQKFCFIFFINVTYFFLYQDAGYFLGT